MIYLKTTIPTHLLEYFQPAEIGLEETPDAYVQKMVEVFREVRRVLRDDGTVWLNLGDSYMAAKNAVPPPQTVSGDNRGMPTVVPPNRKDQEGLKTKDLVGIPWRVALALQADGWYLRQDIIWHKPNPMPESVEDRCTKSHEYIFLLSKKSHYYFDNESIKEPTVGMGKTNIRFGGNKYGDSTDPKHATKSGNEYTDSGLRNKRSVWTVNTRGYKGAHFATFPRDLIVPCVLAGSPVGGIVLDPFNGSGTTGVVSLNLGREYIGCELNPEYIKLTETRIKDEVPNTLEGIME